MLEAQPPALHEVQAWMLAVMTEPDGPRSAAGRASIDAPPAEVVRSTASFGAAARLEIYRRGYRMRLVETMRAHHPALRHALGDEVFDAFALDYLAARPSRSYTLLDLGTGFADHLEATRPDGDESWPDFVIELARLERAFLEVYDGPGAEQLELVAPDQVEPDACLVPAPCLRLMSTRFPVGAYMLAARRGDGPPLPGPKPTWLALSRRDYRATLTELNERSHVLLAALVAGAPLTDAARVAGVPPLRAVDLARDWSERGFFVSPDSPQETR